MNDNRVKRGFPELKTRLLPAISVLLVLLLTLGLMMTAASAEGKSSVNAVWQMEQRDRKVRNTPSTNEQLQEKIKVLSASDSLLARFVSTAASAMLRYLDVGDIWGNLMSATCTVKPTMGGSGTWKLKLDSGISESDVTQMEISLAYIDWNDEYYTIYYEEYDSFQKTGKTCEIVTAGEYEFSAWITLSDGTNGYYIEDFTITGTDELRKKIKQVAAACKGANNWETALNMHDWLTANLQYDGSLSYYGADGILRGKGVCDTYSKAYYMLCAEAGIPVARVHNSGHAWNAVSLDGNWYYVDPTWDDPGMNNGLVSGSESHDYFCLNEELLAKDHQGEYDWFGASAHDCLALADQYYIRTEEWKTWGFLERIQETFDQGLAVCDIDDWYYGDIVAGVLVYGLNDMEIMTLSSGEKVTIEAEGDGSGVSVYITGWANVPDRILELPASLKAIQEEAFAGILATGVVIPDACQSIGSRAFAGSSIREVWLDNESIQIAEDAFADCDRLLIHTNSETIAESALAQGCLVDVP